MITTTINPARARIQALAAAGGATSPVDAATEPAQATTRVMLYAPIGGWFGIYAEDFIRTLDGVDTPNVELHINSPGGDAFEGIAIANTIRQSDKRITAVVDGLAASVASVIAVACNEVVMAPAAQLMIHDAWTYCYGPADDLRKIADDLDKLSGSLAGLYARRGGTADEWRALMRAETWFTDTEAVDAGLADRVLDDTATAAPAATEDVAPTQDPDLLASWDMSVFAHAGRGDAPAPPVLVDGHLRPAASAAGVTPRSSKPVASAAGSTHPLAPAGDTALEGDGVIFSDAQLNHLRRSIGVADDTDADTILAALDECLQERAESAAPTTTVPAGMVALDEGTHAQLLADAQAGRQARDRQLADDRVAAVNAAVADGRIPPARREHWLAQLEADPGARDTLDALAPGLVVNTVERGHATPAAGHGSQDMDEGAAAYNALFPEDEEN